jgi:hypothetical protein
MKVLGTGVPDAARFEAVVAERAMSIALSSRRSFERVRRQFTKGVP